MIVKGNLRSFIDKCTEDDYNALIINFKLRNKIWHAITFNIVYNYFV